MKPTPLVFQHNPEDIIGHFDAETHEITFKDSFRLTYENLQNVSMTTAVRVLETEEVNGVTIIKKMKLLHFSL